MEAYRGLAILTTNAKDAIDSAFMRRIRFVVRFAFPDEAQRAEIWRRAFPAQTPTEGIDAAALGRLSLTGGNICNVALSAAFLAADRGEPVGMSHVAQAARARVRQARAPAARSGGARMDVTPRTVALMVDELVLDGLDPNDALVAKALRDALAPALAEHGLQAASGDSRRRGRPQPGRGGAMSSAFPGSPRLLKGALVVFETVAPDADEHHRLPVQPRPVTRSLRAALDRGQDPWRETRGARTHVRCCRRPRRLR